MSLEEIIRLRDLATKIRVDANFYYDKYKREEDSTNPQGRLAYGIYKQMNRIANDIDIVTEDIERYKKDG
jgi:hypothetical protein